MESPGNLVHNQRTTALSSSIRRIGNRDAYSTERMTGCEFSDLSEFVRVSGEGTVGRVWEGQAAYFVLINITTYICSTTLLITVRL